MLSAARSECNNAARHRCSSRDGGITLSAQRSKLSGTEPRLRDSCSMTARAVLCLTASAL
ncbi:MAG TPA: hypothetical protein VNL98_07335 [Gemmatimonadales bacterium]|nr:hypothetical protein [Gemmatimonadales bacterium]